MPENRSQTRTDEEELVKRFILNNADREAEKVKFLTWGPHLDKQELLELAREAGIVELVDLFGPIEKKDLKKLEAFKSIVRVRYQGPATLAIGLSPVPFALFLEANPDPARSGETRTYDDFYLVYAKIVIHLGGGGSDDWKQQFRKELSKRFPGIKR